MAAHGEQQRQHAATGVGMIAVSGPDNVGKSTQLRMLARRAGPTLAALAGPLDEFDPRWRTISETGMSSWWFERATLEEVADVLACSYLARARRGPERQTAVTLVDRGMPMLEATVAATAAVREGLDVQAGADRARRILAGFAEDIAGVEGAQYGVAMLHADDPAAGAPRALAREVSVTPVYAEYQRCLHLQIERLVEAGRFDAVIVTGDRSIADVQAELRGVFQTVCPFMPAPALAGVRVIALGGLSECGKSTAGEYLRLHHGYARLKIGYLIEDAASRLGLTDAYNSDAVTLAELITDSLDRFCSAHHFLDRISIESLHHHDATAELKKILGDQLDIVYLDVAAETRERRGTAGADDVRERDATKHLRGAAAIAGIADHVVDNNGSPLVLHRRLDLIALANRWPVSTPRIAPINSLGLPIHLEEYLAALVDRIGPWVDLIAVTGSGARGKYQHGWSDLDVLVVAGPDALSAIRQTLTRLADDLGGVKLGLTVVTQAECRTGAVSSRILNVLALIGSGAIVPLWRKPSVALPVPDAASDVRASLRDGVQAAIEIRRQLIATKPELRALYKLTALLAKIKLRIEGIERPNDVDALTELLGAVPADRDDPATVERLARTVLDCWLATLPEAGQDI